MPGYHAGHEPRPILIAPTTKARSPGFRSNPSADAPVRSPSRLPAKLEDQAVRASTYVTDDANWVAFKTTECYAPHQIALAPGLQQHEIPPRWPSLL